LEIFKKMVLDERLSFGSEASGPARRAQRILPDHPVLWNYASKNYSDNFVPKEFLTKLTVGAPNTKSYRSLVLGALHVANHLSLVSALVGTWVSLANGTPGMLGADSLSKASRLFAFEAGSFFFTVLLHYRTQPSTKEQCTWTSKIASHVRQAAILIATVVLLSPVYATLTTSISSDTTIALIIVLMIVHLYLYDYNDYNDHKYCEGMEGDVSYNKRSTTYTTSLMCGMCASVLASTTMRSIIDVIAVTLLALQLYIGSPYFLHGMYGTIGKVWTSVLVSGSVLVGLPLVLKVWLGALLVVIVVLCPMWMVRIDKFKSHISGPWDEVSPSFDSAASMSPKREHSARDLPLDPASRE
jgi:phosphatidylinositol glycan class C protein